MWVAGTPRATFDPPAPQYDDRRRDARAATPSWRAFAAAGALAGVVVVLGAIAGGRVFVSHLPGAWFFGAPGGPLGSLASGASHTRAVAIAAVYGGLAALATLWWRLLRRLWHAPGAPVAKVLGVVSAWVAPFALAPPLFSRDLYSYAAQGEMVSRHINPYHYGTGVLGVTTFTRLAGPFWGTTPSPYGPTFLSIDGWATEISDHHALIDVLLLRLVALAGVALMAVSIPVIARRAGVDPAAAMLLGAGSPLVLTSLVGGGHNDALMAGLLVAGLAAWCRFGPLPAIVLCALGAGAKVPALLAVVVIGWNWPGAHARPARRVRWAALALGIALGVLEVVSAVTGIGWGWVTTLGAPTKVHTAWTPIDEIAGPATHVLHALGVSVATSTVWLAATVAGFAVAGALVTWLTWHSPRVGPVKALGLSLLAVSIFSTVLWPWYVTWGVALSAAVATGRLRRALVWLSVVETLVGASSPVGIEHTLFHRGPQAVLVIVAVVAAVLVAAGPEHQPRALAARARVVAHAAGTAALRRGPARRAGVQRQMPT